MVLSYSVAGKMKPIFCGNFEYDARPSDLDRLFSRNGKVERVDMKSGIRSLTHLALAIYLFIYGATWESMEDEMVLIKVNLGELRGR